MAELRAYLDDDGMQWLAACAIYPSLNWPVAIQFGLSLIEKADRRERVLLRLVRLPWFRHGWMPDWFRDALLARLSTETERRIRRDLEAFLEGTAEGTAADRLLIASAKKPRKDAPDGQNLLEDHVFIEFLAGVRANRLTVHAPTRWRRLLFDRGIVGLGLQRWVSLTATAVLGGAAWLVMDAFIAKYATPRPVKDIVGYVFPNVTEPLPQLDPVSELAVEVATSQIGMAGNSNEGWTFVRWCFARAAELSRQPDPLAAMTSPPPDDDPHWATVQQVLRSGLTGRGFLLDRALVESIEQVVDTKSRMRIISGERPPERDTQSFGTDVRIFTPGRTYGRSVSPATPGSNLYTQLPEFIRGITDQPALTSIHVPEALRSVSSAADVRVAVLATGVSLPDDLASRLLPGRSFVSNEPNTIDSFGHGTFVASLVLAIAPNARIVPVKVLSSKGSGDMSTIADAFRYLAEQPVDVAVMPFGGSAGDAGQSEAIKAAAAAGVLLVAAAGNDGETTLKAPAQFPEVVAAAATDSNGALAKFSARGDKVAIAAPAVNVRGYTFSRSDQQSGTSFAAAIVGGVAALMKGVNPKLSAQDILGILKRTADPIAGEKSFGVVNAQKAVAAAQQYRTPSKTF
jgi:hypothetical protein